MGLFDKIKKAAASNQVPEPVSVQAARDVVCAPVAGRVVPMSEVPDPVFSSEALGPGCGIWPEGETVYAPVTGTVSVTMGHAMGIVSDDGVELIVHVGLDTVDMNGRGFTAYVEKGSHVEAGQPILGFSRKEIADAGHKDVVVLAVTNGASFSSVDMVPSAGSNVTAGAQALKVTK